MSRRLRIYRVDAFTSAPCTGNPANVVLDAEELEEAEMQALTRELGGVDTAFVLPPDGTDHDIRVRFFTPRSETGLVGHATLAVHAVRDALRLPACRWQKQRGSIVEIGRLAGPEAPRYSFRQTAPPLHGPLKTDQSAAVLDALGLSAADLDPGCPSVAAGVGASRALIAVRDGSVLARLRPDLARLASLSAAGNPAGYFVYTLAPAVGACDSEARMFCPAIGIMEDPVSGNAHAMMAAHLHALGRLPDRSGRRELTGRQGHHMGRPGVLTVGIDGSGEVPPRVRVAGSARIVLEATLAL